MYTGRSPFHARGFLPSSIHILNSCGTKSQRKGQDATKTAEAKGRMRKPLWVNGSSAGNKFSRNSVLRKRCNPFGKRYITRS